MAGDVLRARIDKRVKRDATAVLEKIGLTPSDVIRMVMRRIAIEKKLPFEPVVPNRATAEAMEDARAGRVERSRDSKDLLASLNDPDD